MPLWFVPGLSEAGCMHVPECLDVCGWGEGERGGGGTDASSACLVEAS